MSVHGNSSPKTGRRAEIGDHFIKKRTETRHDVGKASGKILDACREKPSVTIPELAALIGITERSVQRNIQKLQKEGLLRRIGGRKEGHWEVLS